MAKAKTDHDEAWRIELQPFLLELAGFLRKHPPSDRPVVVPIGDERIVVTPAEREVLLRTAQRGTGSVSRHFSLMSDGLALRFKVLKDLGELGTASEEARPQVAAAVRHDCELGYKLVHAMQGEMAVLMATGQVEHGRRLAEHRVTLTDILQGSRRVLADAGLETPATPGAEPDAGAHADRSPRPKGDRGGGGKVPRWLPGVVAGLLFLLLAVLLLQLWGQRARDLPPLGASDFPSFPGVERVICRPPGVIVVLTGDRWGRLSREARVQAVENASTAVEHLGYRRLEVRSARGASLATWLDGGKVVVHP